MRPLSATNPTRGVWWEITCDQTASTSRAWRRLGRWVGRPQALAACIGHTVAMWVIVVCIALGLAGLAAVVRWGGLAVEPPPAPAPEGAGPSDPPPVGLLLRRWLPAGRAGGLAYGALLLVAAGTRLEPLRRGNPDFDLVGPGWVAVAAFAALVVFHGMLIAALAGRLSRAVPLLAARPRAIAVHVPLLLLVLPGTSVALVLVLVGAVVVLLSRIPSVVAAWHARRLVTVGRVALAVA